MLKLRDVTEGIYAEFTSHWSEEESLRRLSELTKWSLSQQSIYGTVEPSGISLQIRRDLVRGNGTNFSGTFVEREGKVVVVGKFAVSLFYRGVCSVFLAVLSLFAFFGVAGILLAPGTEIGLVEKMLTVPLWGGALAVFARLVIWNSSPSKRDIVELSNAIRDRISPGQEPPSAESSASDQN